MIFFNRGQAGNRKDFILSFANNTLIANISPTLSFLFLMEEELVLTSNCADYCHGVTKRVYLKKHAKYGLNIFPPYWLNKDIFKGLSSLKLTFRY